MNSRLNKLGMIKGGVCEGIFKQRRHREKGVRRAWLWLTYHKCTVNNNGWLKIIKIPNKLTDLQWVIDNVCVPYGGDAEIGWRRFMQDVATPLLNGKSFRLKWMKKWITDLASFEMGLSSENMPFNEGHALGANGPVKAGYAPPHQPELFNRWIGENN